MNFRLLVFFVLISTWAAGQNERPKIGLTLAGGGAKGLAHIGILKALDSAGLRIDMITGTSMGSVIGSLYAVGYSGKEIEKIARSIDWSSMFSNRPQVEIVNMNEKKEFSNYALEVPFENRKAKLYSGFLEAEEVWLKFGELFYPVHEVKDFSKFSIPFQCIATDAATGKAIVLKDGEIVKAVRASMAIPGIFSAITINNQKLIDGGVVRNFPVRDAKNMGADYVIGVNLSTGPSSADEIKSYLDVLYQISFFKDADDFAQEKKLANLLIEPPVEGFSPASFGSTDSLITIGIETGNRYYPFFKKMADSLKAIYPLGVPKQNRLPAQTDVIIDEIVPVGLVALSNKDFERKLGLELGKSASPKTITQAVRKAFGSNNFRRLAFFIEPTEPGHAKLRCEVIEYPPTTIKVGLHYHSYSDIALITTIATRNFILNRSKSFVKVNWSDNGRVLVRHDQAFGKYERWGALLSFYHERFKFPIYQDGELESEYRSFYTSIDLRFYRLFGTTAMAGFGTAHEWLNFKPKITPTFTFTGGNDYWNSYLFYEKNSQDLKVFPRKGSYVDFKTGINYNQNSTYQYTVNGAVLGPDSLQTAFTAYEYIRLKAGKYIPLSRRLTLMAQTNNGVNFNYKQAFINFYSVGGINDFIRNQIPFVGLVENQVNTYSISTILVGFQFEPVTNFIATLRANAGVSGYVDKSWNELTRENFLTGYALSAGYRSAIGPVEISLLYNDVTYEFKGYVNLGFTF